VATTATPARDRRASRDREEPAGPSVAGMVVLAWLVPGAAHLVLGRPAKAAVFFVVLTGMFGFGIALEGRLFSFDVSEWLVFLAALAEWGTGLPRLVAAVAGVGEGTVTAVTYEYGNTFLMASGLLNALVVLNAVDLARGRGTAS
jgi:hypothetical protein